MTRLSEEVDEGGSSCRSSGPGEVVVAVIGNLDGMERRATGYVGRIASLKVDRIVLLISLGRAAAPRCTGARKGTVRSTDSTSLARAVLLGFRRDCC